MGFRKKIFNKVKTIFGSKSSHAESPPENDVLILQEKEMGEVNKTRGPGSGMGSGDNNVAPTGSHFDEDRIIGNAENIAGIAGLGALDFERQTNVDMRYPNDQRDVGVMEKAPEIWGKNLNTSDNCNHRAADSNDQELLIPSGQPSIQSTGFDGVTNSGISIGGGPVSVSNVIHNNNLTERIRPGLKLLQKRVATSAFHNSAQRVDPPRCHPDTRVAIQKQIYDWILLDPVTRQAWIMWIHGAAGGGKSAIMQSVAEFCEKAHIPLASFFFFRTDPGRNSMAHFVATLVYQLIQKIPQARDEIFTIIESNPLIFDESLESQLQKLVIEPLLRVQKHLKGFFVILIDGVDECTERAHQSDLIKLLGAISSSRTIPVIFLVASRREAQIEAAFARKQISDLILTLPLDNSDVEQTSDDIRHFLTDKFNDIKDTHLLKRHLPVDWPAASVVDEIVDKSSGQFIFASVVVNYLSSPRANPVHQLEVIRGIRLRDSSSQNPFEHLDALYRHIFSQVEALGKVFDIIAFVLSGGTTNINHIGRAFLLEAGEIDVLFADLTAVILCEPHTETDPELKFLHKSLPDFLCDKSRAERYYINCDEYRPKLLCMLLERAPPLLTNNPKHVIERERSRLNAIWNLLEEVKASEQLRSAFMKFNSIFYTKTFLDDFWYGVCPDILERLEKLDFSDQGEAYRHVVDVFAAQYAEYWLLLNDKQKNRVIEHSPNLMVRINQIQQPK